MHSLGHRVAVNISSSGGHFSNGGRVAVILDESSDEAQGLGFDLADGVLFDMMSGLAPGESYKLSRLLFGNHDFRSRHVGEAVGVFGRCCG